MCDFEGSPVPVLKIPDNIVYPSSLVRNIVRKNYDRLTLETFDLIGNFHEIYPYSVVGQFVHMYVYKCIFTKAIFIVVSNTKLNIVKYEFEYNDPPCKFHCIRDALIFSILPLLGPVVFERNRTRPTRDPL